MTNGIKTWLDQRRDHVKRFRNEYELPERVTENPVIRITGERQSGKTEMVLDRMVRHASEGMKVAYVSATLNIALNTFARLEDLQYMGITKFYRGNGNVHADFESGGSIWFVSKDGGSFRGRYFDVVVWDDVQKPIHPDVFVAAKLIYEVTT